MAQTTFVPITVRVIAVYPSREVVPRPFGTNPAKPPYTLHEALLEETHLGMRFRARSKNPFPAADPKNTVEVRCDASVFNPLWIAF